MAKICGRGHEVTPGRNHPVIGSGFQENAQAIRQRRIVHGRDGVNARGLKVIYDSNLPRAVAMLLENGETGGQIRGRGQMAR